MLRQVVAGPKRSLATDGGAAAMYAIASPATEAEVAEAVRGARTRAEPLEIRGGGTRHCLGRPVQAAATLELGGLSGIAFHDPGALTLVAAAGTPLRVVEETLAAAGQRLAFEPMDHRPLLGSNGEPTIGAVAACNISGPRRIQAGACRDSLLGVRFVTGIGQAVSSGGRVMKNVTGYDLVKLLCGSWGTLGVLTEVCFKVLPTPERAATLVLEGLDTEEAVAAMSLSLGSPYEITGAAHLPGDPARTLLRVEGFPGQVDYRLERLCRMYANSPSRTVEGADHDALWRVVRNAEPFAGGTSPVWRLSVRPGDAPAVCTTLQAELSAETFLDWGGGLVWARLPGQETASAEAVRRIVAGKGGHATLVRAAEPIRATEPVFQPRSGRIASLSEALREQFDPDRILNPGRMAA